MKALLPGSLRKQRGMTLPMTALFIVVLFAFASLAVDLGVLYTARTGAQHAADAAALAGAYTLATKTTATDKVAVASDAAIALAAQNKILGTAVSITTVATPPCPATTSGSWVCVDVANRRVSVNVARLGANAVETYFAKVIGWNSVGVATVATAEAGVKASGTHCLKPIFVPNTVAADPSEKVSDACTNGHILFDKFNQSTSFAAGKLGQPIDFRPLDPHNAAAPSQYYTVDFGSGGSTVRCTIANCLNDPDCKADPSIVANFTGKCGQTLTTENGNDVGNITKGFKDLVSDGDTWGGAPGTYCPGGNCDPSSSTSAQVVTAPVWDDCPTGTIDPGKQTFPVIGFVTVFVDKSGIGPGGQITAHLVSVDSCGTSTGGEGTGPGGVPIRLIQVTD